MSGKASSQNCSNASKEVSPCPNLRTGECTMLKGVLFTEEFTRSSATAKKQRVSCPHGGG